MDKDKNKHDEIMLLIRNYLVEHGMMVTVKALDQEEKKVADIDKFKSLVLEGDFTGALKYITDYLTIVNETTSRIVYAIKRQMFMELLSTGLKDQARSLFHTEFAPYFQNESSKLDCNKLWGFLLSNQVPVSESYNGRENTVGLLDELISGDVEVNSVFFPAVIIEEKRLETLLEQSLSWQLKNCSHTTTSLLANHNCSPQSPPAHTLPQSQGSASLQNINASTSGGQLSPTDLLWRELGGCSHSTAATSLHNDHHGQ